MFTGDVYYKNQGLRVDSRNILCRFLIVEMCQKYQLSVFVCAIINVYVTKFIYNCVEL